MSPNTVTWAEIPVSDMERAKRFYAAVLEAELKDNTMGPNPMADLPAANEGSVAGHIYPGKPAPKGTGPTVHMVAPGKLEAIMERVTQAGGEIASPAIEIPVGRFFYALDPDGNSVGFFES